MRTVGFATLGCRLTGESKMRSLREMLGTMRCRKRKRRTYTSSTLHGHEPRRLSDRRRSAHPRANPERSSSSPAARHTALSARPHSRVALGLGISRIPLPSCGSLVKRDRRMCGWADAEARAFLERIDA